MLAFSPSITKRAENDMLAVQTAKEIVHLLEEHNKKMKNKIEFGVGVHKGSLITNSQANYGILP
jgi:D-serine deaminase-like pyridoxal phosphate-dependent protein